MLIVDFRIRNHNCIATFFFILLYITIAYFGNCVLYMCMQAYFWILSQVCRLVPAIILARIFRNGLPLPKAEKEWLAQDHSTGFMHVARLKLLFSHLLAWYVDPYIYLDQIWIRQMYLLRRIELAHSRVYHFSAHHLDTILQWLIISLHLFFFSQRLIQLLFRLMYHIYSYCWF